MSSLVEELEIWRLDHDSSQACLEFEEILKYINAISDILALSLSALFPGIIEVAGFPSEELRGLKGDLALCLDTLAVLDRRMASFESEGYRVEGGQAFRSFSARLRRVSGMIEEAEAEVESARRQCRESMRPVRIDEEGRLFEMDGTPIVVPGLEPEQILAGLDDVKHSRYRPLEDVFGSKNQRVINKNTQEKPRRIYRNYRRDSEGSSRIGLAIYPDRRIL